MAWNWQRSDWPRFTWQASRLAKAEEQFLLGGGVLVGISTHLDDETRERVIVEAMSSEALATSEIEGEILDRESVQSSIRRELGLSANTRRARPAERGIARLTVAVYRDFAAPLDQATLFDWHRMVMSGRRDLRDVGRYRSHADAMQVVSGRLDRPKVHFEAPPSKRVRPEMNRFIQWFNRTMPTGPETLPALTRAGTAHLYFESIHPFEDGNGRIGRAIAEKVLAQSLGRPSLTALAATILARRGDYYDALEAANKHNEISRWLAWFAGITLEAQQRTLAQIEFLIDKSRLLDRLRDSLIPRQRGVLLRMLREGPEGWKGGLTASKYVTLAKVSTATATRDLVDLVEKGALQRTGERRHARYHLPIPQRPVVPIVIDEAGNVVRRSVEP